MTAGIPPCPALPVCGEGRPPCYRFPGRGHVGLHRVKSARAPTECSVTVRSTGFRLQVLHPVWWVCPKQQRGHTDQSLAPPNWAWPGRPARPAQLVRGLTLIGLGSVHQVGPIQIRSSVGQGHQAGVGHGRPSGLLDVCEGAIRGRELSCTRGEREDPSWAQRRTAQDLTWAVVTWNPLLVQQTGRGVN